MVTINPIFIHGFLLYLMQSAHVARVLLSASTSADRSCLLFYFQLKDFKERTIKTLEKSKSPAIMAGFTLPLQQLHV